MTVDRVAGTALAALAALVLWEARRLPMGSLSAPGPAYAPVALAVLLLLLGLLLAAAGGRSPRLAALGWGEAPHALAILAAAAFAALALERLGYRITMTVLVFALLRLVERRGTLFAAGFALALAGLSFQLFDRVLRVPLPRGPLGI